MSTLVRGCLSCLVLAACTEPEPAVPNAVGIWVLSEIDGRPVPAPSANAGGEILGATLRIFPDANLVMTCPATTIDKPAVLEMNDGHGDPNNYGYSVIDRSRIALHYRDGWQPDTLVATGGRADFHYRVTLDPATVAEHWKLRKVSDTWDPAVPMPACDQP